MLVHIPASVRLGVSAMAAMLLFAAFDGATRPETHAPPPDAAAAGCDPSVARCFALHLYYSDATYTTGVGSAHRDCDATDELAAGNATPYHKTYYLPCP
jgi:hypothetical protein